MDQPPRSRPDRRVHVRGYAVKARATLALVPNAERRLRLGHDWIFSNEVDAARTPLPSFEPGELATVVDARNKPVGTAYINPQALICGRLLSGDAHAKIDERWFIARIERALELREKLIDVPFYRAVFGESDGLPGVVVDRYDNTLVVQLNTAGARALREPLVAALEHALSPAGIWLTSAASILELEHIAPLDETLGSVPQEIEVEENGLTYWVALREGQKTGFYFDQRENRLALRRFAASARVLDVYSYVGAWGINAAVSGAAETTCVDRSQSALAFAERNARRNGATIVAEEGEALDVMRAMATQRRKFDTIVVDPPALVKRKRDLAAGASHYEAINEAAMRLISQDGFLISSSCSYHFGADALRTALLRAAKKSGRRLSLLGRSGQPVDHPVHPAMPETEYLKTWFCRVD